MTDQNYGPVRDGTTFTERMVKKRPKKRSRAYAGQAFSTQELAFEQWQPIAGYEGRYVVSNLGRIKSLITRKLILRNGGFLECKGGIRKTQLDRYGRECVTFKVKSRPKTLSISRIVATAFHPNPDQLPEVNHVDGNRLNNRASNLEWSTTEANRQHKIDNRLQPSLPLEVVAKIQTDYRSRTGPEAVNRIAQEHGVSIWTVRRIGMPSSTYLTKLLSSN